MKYFLLADCSTNVADCCSDYGIAVYLNIIQNALKIIQVIVPIILMEMLVILVNYVNHLMKTEIQI